MKYFSPFSDVENTMNTLRYADRVKELRAGDNGGIISNENDQIPKGLTNYIYINK
jgi:hypothetical protein